MSTFLSFSVNCILISSSSEQSYKWSLHARLPCRSQTSSTSKEQKLHGQASWVRLMETLQELTKFLFLFEQGFMSEFDRENRENIYLKIARFSGYGFHRGGCRIRLGVLMVLWICSKNPCYGAYL